MLGRRERKKVRTREALQDAALRLALEHGYEQLTVEAITDAVDVSVRTFFNYFGSKDDVLLSPDPQRVADLVAALAARPRDEAPVAALREVFGELADGFTSREPLWQARMALVRANPQLWPRLLAAFAEFERNVAEAIAARVGRDAERDLYPGVVATAVVGAMRVAVAHWRAGGPATSLRRLFDDAFDVLATGLVPPDESSGETP